MPELPEITHLSRQMHRALRGRRVSAVEIRQPRCLNATPRRFAALLRDKTIDRVDARGKWIFVHLAPGATLLISLGMGGDLLLHEAGAALPERYQLKIGFAGGSCVTIRFWWFGYAHAMPDRKLPSHAMTAGLGLNPLSRAEFTRARFDALLEGRRGAIKALLMDQRRIAGIGNVYIQDILFTAGIHPDRPIPAITAGERGAAARRHRRESRRGHEARRPGLREGPLQPPRTVQGFSRRLPPRQALSGVRRDGPEDPRGRDGVLHLPPVPDVAGCPVAGVGDPGYSRDRRHTRKIAPSFLPRIVPAIAIVTPRKTIAQTPSAAAR